MIFATTASPLLAYLTPTAGFMYALVIMFAFNIWAGMRAVALVAMKLLWLLARQIEALSQVSHAVG